MIKLKLSASQSNFAAVSELKGMHGLELDTSFGLLLIDPKTSLYIVRVASIDHLEYRRSLSPEIIEAYGDIRISTT